LGALTWPILFVLLRRRPLTWADGALLWGALFMLHRSSEPSGAQGMLLLPVATIRLRRGPQHATWKQRTIMIGCLALCLLVILTAIACALAPPDVENRSSFFHAIYQQLDSPVVCLSFCFGMLIAMGFVSGEQVYAVAALVPAAFYALVIVFSRHGVPARVSFACRSTCVTLLPFLLLCSVVAWRSRRTLGRLGWTAVTVFIAILVLGNVWFSSDWNTLRKAITQVVTTREGFVPIEQTAACDSPFGWDWNNTQLGLAWSGPRVRAILLNRKDVPWEPFDPRRQLVLREYLEYDERLEGVVRQSGGVPVPWPEPRRANWIERAWKRLLD